MADLQYYLCAQNWMRSSIPEYSPLVATWADLYEQSMKSVNSRKKPDLVQVNMSDVG